MTTNFYCNYCNKKYSSYQTLWKHNKKYHTNNDNNENKINNKKYNCKNCSKMYVHKQSLYKHIKKCINNINPLINELNIGNKITNNIVNNNITINNIIINKVGYENIDDLTEEERKTILNDNKEPISKMIEIINFNERLPNNHNFCTTSLNSKYLSVYDKKTNKINKEKKINLFRNLMDTTIIKIKQLFNEYKEKYNEKIRDILENHINEFINIKKIILDDKYKRNIYSNINLISYNKKDLILNTWNKIKNSEIEDETTWEDDFNEECMNKNKKNIYYIVE